MDGWVECLDGLGMFKFKYYSCYNAAPLNLLNLLNLLNILNCKLLLTFLL